MFYRGRRSSRCCRFHRRLARYRVRLLQITNRRVHRWGIFALAERMLFAAFNASPAERALPGIVAPGEFALAALEVNGARSAAELADCATRAARRVELDQAAKPLCDAGT